jgi:predicted  nucleic acid-binding Zn-ribbon protein
MTTTTTTQAPTAVYDPAALYAKWTEAAKHTRWTYKNERVNEYRRAMERADAWSDGAANLYVAEDITAYLIKQMQQLDSDAKDARATYADMLNDVHASRGEVVELRAIVARQEAELAELRARLAADATV